METRIYCEACDASAAVRIGRTSFFAAASDEDNILRVFDRKRPGTPIARLDVTPFLELDDPEHPEADLEGAAIIGDRIYWIGSHGRSSKGKERKVRRRLFATTVRHDDDRVELEPVGLPYKRLIKDLLTSEPLAHFGIDDLEGRSPEEPGAINIEGLAATPDGQLLIGFRNPIPQGRALIVRMANPAAVVEGRERAVLHLGGHLDLGGRGIRAIEYIPASSTYLVIAGAHDDSGNFAMYHWNGTARHAPVHLAVEGLDTINPEELALAGIGPVDLLVDVFSDDGTSRCKNVAVARRTFRGTTLPVRI